MELKIGDIADLTGIPERDIRALIQTYESLFTYRTIGPVRIFPERAVQIVREIVDLSEGGLTTGEIIEAIRSGGAPASPEEADRPGVTMIEFRVMQETLARQERRIAHLTAELAREREEIDRLRQAIDGLQEQLSVVAEWVDYFDLQMDEVTLPASERIRRWLG